MAEEHRKVGNWKLWIGVVVLLGALWFVMNFLVGAGSY
jgi:hypothetical protein